MYPSCLLRLPGSDKPRPIVEATAWREGTTSTLYDPDSNVRGSTIGPKDRRYLRGQVAALPPTCWHHLAPRDVPGSTRLRASTEADARALIAAIPATGAPTAVPEHVATAAIDGLLPEITHARLRTGIVGFAMIAAKQIVDRDRLAGERAPGKIASNVVASAGESDPALLAGLGGWVERQWSQEGRAWAQLEATAQLFASEDRSDRYQHEIPASTLDWLDLAVSRSSLAFIATAIGTPADKRKSVAELFAKIATALPPAEKLRIYSASGTLALPGEGIGFRIRWWNGNAYVTRKVGWSGDAFRVLEYAPAGSFHPLPGMLASYERRGVPGLGPEAAKDVLAAIALGKTSWSEQVAARLAEATGLTRSEATYLWAGAPNAHDRSANFLPKELREQFGLKATQAAIARDGLATIPLGKRLAAIDEAARAGVAALLDGSAGEVLARAWTRIIGKKIAVPEELIADADRELAAPMEPSPALAMIGAAREVPELNVDGIWAFGKDGAVIRASKPEPLVGQDKLETEAPVFTAGVMSTLVVYLPFLYAELPVGHPLRAQAVVAHELALARLANPALWITVGHHYWEPAKKAELEKLLDALGFEKGELKARRIPGALVTYRDSRAGYSIAPAELDAKAIAVVGKLAAQIPSYGLSIWLAVQHLRSPGLAQQMARIGATPVPMGGWEQNPLASAGKLVDKAAKKLGVTKDAAALYLQYLTLLWPTPKNVQLWNGWKPKQFETANDELVANELVLEAKRERAQRGHFLPGGWEALKSPHPPMESWKVALYGTRDADGDPVAPLGRFLALAPFHTMFEAAWQRIESGDVPRYEEVKR